MSVGNVTQALRMDQHGLTLVLGNNLDLGGDGARNGVGKTTMVNALSYAIYGNALTNIRKENLINKTNTKGMLVTVEFEKNGNKYRIERGRKPNLLRFIVDDHEVNEAGTDEGAGENRVTQEAIDKIIGMSSEMFKHLVALNTYTQPFLSLKSNEQRDIIEELLGITQLSEKAEILREQIKLSKEMVREEEARIKAFQESNARVQSTIDDLGRRSRTWDNKKTDDVSAFTLAIQELENTDIEAELEAHRALSTYKENESRLKLANKELATRQSNVKKLQDALSLAQKSLASIQEHQCPSCGQDVHDEKHDQMVLSASAALELTVSSLKEEHSYLAQADMVVRSISQLSERPKTKYQNVEDAAAHKNNLENIRKQLDIKAQEEDPYQEQIETLKKTALAEVSWDEINRVSKLLEHQEFLLKLLTSKDSFVRKRIIEQNLAYLNHRLSYYLDKLQLPHTVSFRSDLEVDISQLGQSFDFDNLSRGERNRLILALSWSFRDVYESFTEPMNLLFIDELVDSGMDAVGIDHSMSVLKAMGREMNRNIFLISHRDELASRVNNVLMVVKENGFTMLDTDVQVNEIN
ncbi:endonuclease subunit [uncultured Caudovirales phage]|uniref:Endonuclease subunit n=1 Tax=uncultured Caudovirales phage TaxID=2100421 RepID=A0A6J5TB38_9CAUD|nr:endonuclease subunit [uncultured Caudovirales phage]